MTDLTEALEKIDKYFFVSDIGLNITHDDLSKLKKGRFPNLTSRMIREELTKVTQWIEEKKPNIKKQEMFFIAMARLDKANKRVGQ